jgi:hypothetical protein
MKPTGKNAQIRFSTSNLKTLGWLSKRFGGLDRTSVVKMAINELERRERASLRAEQAPKDNREYPHRPCSKDGCEKMAIVGCFGCEDHVEEIG